MHKQTGRTRFVVLYHPKDCVDDWDLLRYSEKKYFDDLDSAKKFAEENKHKGKPFYWQPNIWKEHEFERTETYWRSVR